MLIRSLSIFVFVFLVALFSSSADAAQPDPTPSPTPPLPGDGVVTKPAAVEPPKLARIVFDEPSLLLCKPSEQGSESCAKSYVVKATVTATDRENDPLSYTCSSKVGVIRSCGKSIDWDLSDVGPGVYFIDVEVADEEGKSNLTQSISVTEYAGCAGRVCGSFTNSSATTISLLEKFIALTNNNPVDSAVIVSYGSATEVQAQQKQIKTYLSFREIDASRYTFLQGVKFSERGSQFYLLPPGAPGPARFGNISGSVLKHGTKEGVPGAYVELIFDEQVKNTATTDPTGQYKFEQISAIDKFKVRVRGSTTAEDVTTDIGKTVPAPTLTIIVQ